MVGRYLIFNYFEFFGGKLKKKTLESKLIKYLVIYLEAIFVLLF